MLEGVGRNDESDDLNDTQAGVKSDLVDPQDCNISSDVLIDDSQTKDLDTKNSDVPEGNAEDSNDKEPVTAEGHEEQYSESQEYELNPECTEEEYYYYHQQQYQYYQYLQYQQHLNQVLELNQK